MLDYKGQLFSVEAIVQSDTTVIDPHLKGLLILAAGDLAFVDIEDTAVTLTFPSAANGGAYPFLLPVGIRRIKDTGTTLTDANMFGIR